MNGRERGKVNEGLDTRFLSLFELDEERTKVKASKESERTKATKENSMEMSLKFIQ
jgi:hypothetical protein